MALDTPTTGGGRALLADALAKLTRQYAGSQQPGQQVLTDEQLRAWLAANPQHDLGPGSPNTFGGMIVPGWTPQATAAKTAPPPAAGAFPASDRWGYGNTGWGPTGVNLYNPLLARGDVAAPGPIGEGPGMWTMDDYGAPFWRSDWVWTGDPSDPWDVKGET